MNNLGYGWICTKQYKECKFRSQKNKKFYDSSVEDVWGSELKLKEPDINIKLITLYSWSGNITWNHLEEAMEFEY